jgi:hypothetical protein
LPHKSKRRQKSDKNTVSLALDIWCTHGHLNLI